MIEFSTDPCAEPGLIAVDVPGFDRFYVDSYHAAELRARLLVGATTSTDPMIKRWLDELTADAAQQQISS